MEVSIGNDKIEISRDQIMSYKDYYYEHKGRRYLIYWNHAAGRIIARRLFDFEQV